MLRLSFVAALYLLTTSCLESKKDDKPSVTPRNNGNAALLIGNWGSGCIGNDYSSFQVNYSFTSNYMEFNQINYNDNNFDCSEPSFQERYRFNYIANNGLLEVKEVTQLFLTSYSEDEVIMYNNNNYCGFNDWVVDEEKEVDILECGITMDMEYSNVEFEVISSILRLWEYGSSSSNAFSLNKL